MIFLERHDRRSFVHKRLFGAAKGFVTGGVTGAASGFITGGQKQQQKQQQLQIKFPGSSRGSATTVPRLDANGVCVVQNQTDGTWFGVPMSRCLTGQSLVPGGGPPSTGCTWPARWSERDQRCRIFVGEDVGRDPTPGGDALMGQYGAALQPGNIIIDRADCTFRGTVRGMILGNDGLCYNKAQLTNKERMWPRGRRPLLTGGDMRAISTAARAGRRLEATTKRLQKIGLMKKPVRRPVGKASERHRLQISSEH